MKWANRAQAEWDATGWPMAGPPKELGFRNFVENFVANFVENRPVR
jgi:hypothetical protein